MPKTTEPDASGSLYIGLMSGTSVDAIDSVLTSCHENDIEILATHQHPIPADIRRRIAEISQPGANEIERLGVLDRDLGELFAQATLDLLAAAKVQPRQIRAIGSHGQTIRHRPRPVPEASEQCFTLQIGDPNTIAERTGITTVADFRRRDIAAGGEGAPLAPGFHAARFTDPEKNRAVVNIGGIANVTLLERHELISGFDTGPGNTLMDHWTMQHREELFDRDGQWAATGNVVTALLHRLLDAPYFKQSGPRSTGKELFNLNWLEASLAHSERLNPADVQATLAELTAVSIARAITDSDLTIDEVYICGGGAHNRYLVNRLMANLAPRAVASTAAIGMDPDWVEAVTFAWLAYRRLHGLAGNSPAVTGAEGLRTLGGVYCA